MVMIVETGELVHLMLRKRELTLVGFADDRSAGTFVSYSVGRSHRGENGNRNLTGC